METFSALLAICVGNSLVPGEFPTQRPVTLSFDVFFDLHLNKRLSKQSWGWCFEMPSCPLWCHLNGQSLTLHLIYMSIYMRPILECLNITITTSFYCNKITVSWQMLFYGKNQFHHLYQQRTDNNSLFLLDKLLTNSHRTPSLYCSLSTPCFCKP